MEQAGDPRGEEHSGGGGGEGGKGGPRGGTPRGQGNGQGSTNGPRGPATRNRGGGGGTRGAPRTRTHPREGERLRGHPDAEIEARRTLAYSYSVLGLDREAAAVLPPALAAARQVHGEESPITLGVASQTVNALNMGHVDLPEAERICRNSLVVAARPRRVAHGDARAPPQAVRVPPVPGPAGGGRGTAPRGRGAAAKYPTDSDPVGTVYITENPSPTC